MSARVVDLDDYRPAVIVRDRDDESVNVYPVQFWLDWIEQKPGLEAPAPGVIRQIVAEWLACQVEHGGFSDLEPDGAA